MATHGITDADERLHPVEDPSPHWSDSLYFNAWDPGTDTFLMTRIAVLGNAGRVTGGMIVWVDGELVYGYGRELDEIPPDRLGRHDHRRPDLPDAPVGAGVGGAARRRRRQGAPRVARAQPRHLLRRPPHRPPPEGRGVGPLRAELPGHRRPRTSAAHRIAFDGFGQRDHSWGFRHWAGPRTSGTGSPASSPTAGPSTSSRSTPRRRDHVNGFVHGPDGDEYVTSRRPRAGPRPTTVAPSATGDPHHRRRRDPRRRRRAGRRLDARAPGRATSRSPCTRPRCGSRADGVPGYGIYEHLVTEFD